MTMMPRGRGQNDAAVKSHPRRCSERHKEEDAAACPRLLCANTKYTILLLSRLERRKSEGGGAAARASCDDDDDDDDVVSNTQQTSVQKNKERERERGEKLSHNTQKLKKKEDDDCFVFVTLFCVHTKNAPIDRTCGSKRLLFFFVQNFFCLSLSLDTQKTHFLKP